MEDSQVTETNLYQADADFNASTAHVHPTEDADAQNMPDQVAPVPYTAPTQHIAAGSGDSRQDIQTLLTEISGLKQDFETKIKYDESKERLIESLHKELQVYRQGFHFRILRPLFTDLITMYDDMGKMIDGTSNDPSSSNSSLERCLKIFQEGIEEILWRNGVETFTSEDPVFLSSSQRILRVVPTSDPAQDRCIAKRVRRGFKYEGTILRPEIVETYKYTPE